MASNKSIEEIQEEINAMQGEATYRGSIKLDRKIYPLVDIKVCISGENSTTLYADVVEPTFDLAIIDETAIVGHITVMIAPSGSRMVGKGELIMNKGEHVGSYNVSLDIQPILAP